MKSILLLAFVFLPLATFASEERSLRCTVQMTDDNGFRDGTKIFGIHLNGANTEIIGLSSYGETVQGVEPSGDTLNIWGYNASYNWGLWLTQNQNSAKKSEVGVIVNLYTGVGTQYGEGKCTPVN